MQYKISALLSLLILLFSTHFVSAIEYTTHSPTTASQQVYEKNEYILGGDNLILRIATLYNSPTERAKDNLVGQKVFLNEKEITPSANEALYVGSSGIIKRWKNSDDLKKAEAIIGDTGDSFTEQMKEGPNFYFINNKEVRAHNIRTQYCSKDKQSNYECNSYLRQSYMVYDNKIHQLIFPKGSGDSMITLQNNAIIIVSQIQGVKSYDTVCKDNKVIFFSDGKQILQFGNKVASIKFSHLIDSNNKTAEVFLNINGKQYHLSESSLVQVEDCRISTSSIPKSTEVKNMDIIQKIETHQVYNKYIKMKEYISGGDPLVSSKFNNLFLGQGYIFYNGRKIIGQCEWLKKDSQEFCLLGEAYTAQLQGGSTKNSLSIYNLRTGLVGIGKQNDIIEFVEKNGMQKMKSKDTEKITLDEYQQLMQGAYTEITLEDFLNSLSTTKYQTKTSQNTKKVTPPSSNTGTVKKSNTTPMIRKKTPTQFPTTSADITKYTKQKLSIETKLKTNTYTAKYLITLDEKIVKMSRDEMIQLFFTLQKMQNKTEMNRYLEASLYLVLAGK